jgi:hypothetical protein
MPEVLLRVVLLGGTGMLGSWLRRELRDRGDEVLVVTRREATDKDELSWTPSRGIADVRRLEGFDVVFNLTGAPIADRPWTRQRRHVLRESRVEAARILLASLSRLEQRPRTYIGIGHLGFYGDRRDEILDESTTRGEGFLADLAAEWENAHFAAKDTLGARTAVLRLAVSLSPTGGVFPLMVQPFRVGLGGWLGDGRQYLPWTDIRDVTRAMRFLADHEGTHGVYNGGVPEPTRQKEWARALGRAMERTVQTNAPRWALRGAFGELADDLFLASIRAVPKRLLQAGFRFEHADPEATFRWLVSTWEGPPAALDSVRPEPGRRRAVRPLRSGGGA